MNSRNTRISTTLIAMLAMAGQPRTGTAHHTYAMFDASRSAQVTGTVAMLEWRNPHVYLWIHVKDPKSASGHTLYAFENGAPNVLERRGWSKDLLHAGDRITVTYWPLNDGRPGGHFESATLGDGRVLRGAGGPRGVNSNGPVKP